MFSVEDEVIMDIGPESETFYPNSFYACIDIVKEINYFQFAKRSVCS